MALVHSKETVITIDGDDISQYCNASDLARSADAHDVTTYGKDSRVFKAGLKTATGSASGFYDSTASTGPRAVLEPLVGGPAVTLVRRPEGTGSGLPQDSVDVLVQTYTESAPVADFVTWSASLQLSDDITTTAQ
jgi:hypothetical protein